MKFRFILLTAVAFTFAALVQALDYPLAPIHDYFSMTSWKEREVVVIDKDLLLTEDTMIKADEVVLKAVIYTKGFALKIDALQLTFEAGGAIRGFNVPAAPGDLRAQGPRGESNTNSEGKGGNGFTPEIAQPGRAGVQKPGAIVIYAARIVGEAVIDGTGEQGGKGGHGGKGGDGGKGGPGKSGTPHCSFWKKEHNGTDGGKGGQGAAGGDGGVGGNGGGAIPIVLVSGETPAQQPVLISSPGEPGLGGDPGEPGNPGPGGDGGPGRSKGCGIFGKASVAGGHTGPAGDSQTKKGKPGATGLKGPKADLTTEPIPQFASLANPKTYGIISTRLADLENARFKLVDAWSQFHWARNFMFLTLDTLQELRKDGPTELLTEADLTSNAGLLDQILASVDNSRLEKLTQLWKENQIQTPQVLNKSELPMIDAVTTSARMVDFLNAIAKGQSGSAEAAMALEELRAGIQVQMASALTDALESCRAYNAVKETQMRAVLNLTSQYSVPVCEGKPDFRQKQNVDQRIELFSRQHAIIPDVLAILPEAHAEEGFEVVPVKTEDVKAAEIQSRLPGKGVWQTAQHGVFVGFPSVKRAHSSAEIGSELYLLKQNLLRIWNR